jgi:hypothetical protein
MHDAIAVLRYRRAGAGSRNAHDEQKSSHKKEAKYEHHYPTPPVPASDRCLVVRAGRQRSPKSNGYEDYHGPSTTFTLDQSPDSLAVDFTRSLVADAPPTSDCRGDPQTDYLGLTGPSGSAFVTSTSSAQRRRPPYHQSHFFDMPTTRTPESEPATFANVSCILEDPGSERRFCGLCRKS